MATNGACSGNSSRRAPSARSERAPCDFIHDAIDLGTARCRIGHAAVDLADESRDHSVEVDKQFVDPPDVTA
jgi:hypothetical protein